MNIERDPEDFVYVAFPYPESHIVTSAQFQEGLKNCKNQGQIINWCFRTFSSMGYFSGQDEKTWEIRRRFIGK